MAVPARMLVLPASMDTSMVAAAVGPQGQHGDPDLRHPAQAEQQHGPARDGSENADDGSENADDGSENADDGSENANDGNENANDGSEDAGDAGEKEQEEKQKEKQEGDNASV